MLIFDINCGDLVIKSIILILNRHTPIKWGYVKIRNQVKYATSIELPIKIGLRSAKLKSRNDFNIVIDATPSKSKEFFINDLTYELCEKLLLLLTNEFFVKLNERNTIVNIIVNTLETILNSREKCDLDYVVDHDMYYGDIIIQDQFAE